jgi:hypothetical protein
VDTKIDPIRIVNACGIPGTLGCLIHSSHGEVLFLTNYHVLYGRGAKTGDKVWAIFDDFRGATFTEVGRTTTGQIGRVTYHGETCFVDCAVGSLAPDSEWTGPLRQAFRETPKITAVTCALVGTRVFKYGAATGLTEGIITDVAHYDRPFIEGRVYDAPDQILIQSNHEDFVFSAPSDSGAVIWDVAQRAIGLLWGSTFNGEGIACPIAPVLAHLGISPEPLW